MRGKEGAWNMSNENANADLIADYLGEASEYVDRLNQGLLELSEGDGVWPQDKVNALFRCAHSLKGLSACFGYDKTNKVTHELESLLTLVRDGKVAPTTAIVRVMFDAVDLVQTLTAEIAGSGHEHVATEIVLESLERARGAAAPEPGKAEAGPARDEATPAASGPTAANPEANETVRVRMERLDRMVNLTGELVVARSRFQLVARQLRALHRLTEFASESQDLARGLEELEAATARRGGDDRTRQRLEGMLEQARRLHAIARDFDGRVLRDVDDVAYDLDGVVSEIHEAVLQLRMVPLESVFRRLHRVVRDTADTLGKGVDFEVLGGETQIDKRVADELVNPLVHMLRNAVDHGLESTATRRSAGKPERGHVVVAAFQRGSSVVIELRDDGGGIDPGKVLKKAVESGLVTSEEAAAMSPQQAQRLIFAPGFSTAAAVTEVSGRGMGMDIVADGIKRLRGSLELKSEVGKGTVFTVQLPPSMSIQTSLLLQVRGTMFALPLTEVREIVELQRVAVQHVQSRRMIVVRDRPMPLVLLPEAYRFPEAAASCAAPADEGAQHAIVFGFPGNEVALGVDRLVGKEDLVLKPLCPELAAVRGLAGMAIRGDGKVTLILDPQGFADHAMRRHGAAVALPG
ncbi:MAG: chemotaxis protein CheA [Planctomycetes bacterium]|nr:chemotaxis protein CheA [Planctomycetota bacterium]